MFGAIVESVEEFVIGDAERKDEGRSMVREEKGKKQRAGGGR